MHVGINQTHQRMLAVFNRAKESVRNGENYGEVAESAILLAALETPLSWLAGYKEGDATVEELRREASRRVSPFSGPFSASTDTLGNLIQGVSAYYWAQILQALDEED